MSADRDIGYTSVDIFKDSSAKAYIDYCSRPQPPWEYLEKPMWDLIINEQLKLPDAVILDVGIGTGRLYKLLMEHGAEKTETLAIEPNPELSMYLHTELHIPCIKGGSQDMGHHLLQHEEFDLITANMVVNHMSGEEYVDFVKYTSGALHSNGLLLYTIPFPEGKAKKHGFDVSDNTVVIEEEAKWGGFVEYHHRSEEYQVEVLKSYGFEPNRILFGYEDFISEHILKSGERTLGKSLRGPKRVMFWAQRAK